MNQQTTAPAKLNGKPITNPLARDRAANVFPYPSAFAKYQGGCVRAWLLKNAGVVLIAIGWIIAFVPVLAPNTDYVTAFIAAAWLFGLGVGWLVRGEGGGK